MRRTDITRLYTLVERSDGQLVMNTLEEARALATTLLSAHERLACARYGEEATDPHIWFVRDGGRYWDVWDVESWGGQFVNALGFLVTKEACLPAHKGRIFKY